MKIVSLQAENVKRLRAVEIRPDGALVVIKGKNGAGKSSVLDAIWMALGGKSAIPSEPVRTGNKKASIRLELTDLVVTRTLTPDGGGTLKVEGKDGTKFSSPQAMLDKLVANLSFDPLEFSRMKPKAQAATLSALVGLDFSKQEIERQKHFERRTDVNREVKRLEGELSGVREHRDAPADELSVAAMMDELRAGEAVHAKIAKAVADAKLEERKAADARAEVEKLRSRAIELKGIAEQADKKADALSLEGYSLAKTAPDVAAMRTRIASADAVNTKVRENKKRAELAKKLSVQRAAAEGLTDSIQSIDDDKQRQLQEAAFPLPGLSLTYDGVTLNNLPFEQASSAEQLRASVAIGLALNPKLRVLLVRDGSLLDEDSLRLVAEMATAKDAQVWVERVGTHDAIGVLIEDGAVAGALELAPMDARPAENDQTAEAGESPAASSEPDAAASKELSW